MGGIERKLSKAWMRRARVSGSGGIRSLPSGASGIDGVGLLKLRVARLLHALLGSRVTGLLRSDPRTIV